jgi:hypothetical protein
MRKWIAAAVLASAVPPAALVLLNWKSYVNVTARLANPNDTICSGEPACVSEIAGETYADFLLTVFLGAPLMFALGLAVCASLFFLITWFQELRRRPYA